MHDLWPVQAVYQSNHNIEDALDAIPEDVFVLCGLISQVKVLEGKKIMLMMGFCKMPGRESSFSAKDIPKTKAIVRFLEMDGANPVLLVDVRNEIEKL